jgi:hypothetical protein
MKDKNNQLLQPGEEILSFLAQELGLATTDKFEAQETKLNSKKSEPLSQAVKNFLELT